MGAGDWASDMTAQLVEEFDISYGQAHRLTLLIRQFASHPDYDGLSGEFGSDRWREQKRLLIDDLPTTLRARSGDTLEERWNTLMDELEYQKRTRKGVYLDPWSEETLDELESLALHPDREFPGLHRRE